MAIQVRVSHFAGRFRPFGAPLLGCSSPGANTPGYQLTGPSGLLQMLPPVLG